jgi:hypothetical protein
MSMAPNPVTGQGSIGAGQQTPYDSNTQMNVVAFAIRQIMNQLNVCQPAQVTAVHAGSGSPPSAGTVDVQLLVSLLDGAGNSTPQGIIYGLPYFRIIGGKWSIVCDPAVNDIGFIVCCDRDITALISALSSGGSPSVTPGSNRKYSVSDSIFVCGLGTNQATQASLWLKSDGTFAFTDVQGNVVSSSSSGITITPASGQPVAINGRATVNGDLAVTGQITATSQITANFGGTFVTLTQHQHTANNTPPTPGH